MTARTLDQLQEPSDLIPQPGRYLAENGRWFVQLRVESMDMGESFDISADLQSREQDGHLELWVKTRPSRARPTLSEGAWRLEADWLDDRGGRASGTISLAANGDHQLKAHFTINESLSGLAPGFVLAVRAARVSSALRDLGLEIEWEEGQEVELSTTFNKRGVEVKSILHDAGLDVHDVGSRSTIPKPAGGTWSSSDVFSALNDQLRRSAQAPLTSPAWELHLMLLSKTDRPGLLGVMFDFADDLPRQGAAVFVQEIRDRCDDKADLAQRVLATAVHELGHCLNLTHRFNREVGRADSRSFMNYDWLYKGGNRVGEYWQDFRYTFDPDELEFLRHAPRDQIVPGGAPFGSARYWPPASQPVRAVDGSKHGLHLWLTAPATGLRFGYGQPVFLEVSLRNVSGSMACLPKHALDVKAGLLEILIRRLPKASRWNSAGEREPFLPFMRRCFSVDDADRLALYPGESLHDNLNLTFGAAGSPFAEPGDYTLTPVLTLYDEASGGIDKVIEGAELSITIERPASRTEERDADLLRRSDIGVSLGLGGASCLSGAAETLRSVADRRNRDRPASEGPDGLVAACYRMMGIDAGRRGDRRQARELLDSVTESRLLATFDPHTAHHTRLLAARQHQEEGPRFTEIHVDLATRNEGSDASARSLSGVLVSRTTTRRHEPAEGVAVLVDADALDRDTVSAAAALFSSSDGLSQRVSVTGLEIFQDKTSAQPLALGLLSRSVTVADPIPLSLDELWNLDSISAVRSVLDEQKVPLTSPDPDWGSAGEYAPVHEAERSAPWASPSEAGSVSVPQRLHDVASLPRWLCLLTNRCNEAPPGTDPRLSPGKRPKRLPTFGCLASGPREEELATPVESAL